MIIEVFAVRAEAHEKEKLGAVRQTFWALEVNGLGLSHAAEITSWVRNGQW